MNNIAIITARGGSKRIPRKNIKDFFGQPIVKYSIDAALKSNVFNTVMVSTDDNEIAEISKQFGADVPFLRSEKTSNDFATTNDVLLEVISKYKEQNITFESLCCIYPCAPFLTPDILKNAYNKFIKSNSDELISVVRYSFPIQRAMKINNSGFLEYANPEFKNIRSQDLEPMFHDAGMFYFYNYNTIANNNKNIVHFELKESEIQDIDTEEDWKNAEIKYSILKGVKY